MGTMRLKRRKASLDDVLQIALTRVYSPTIAQHILAARANHTMVEVSPQGEIRSHSAFVSIPFASMPVGTLWIHGAAWRKTNIAHTWAGIGTSPENWRLSLIFLLLAPDIRDPTKCQFYDLDTAQDYWRNRRVPKTPKTSPRP